MSRRIAIIVALIAIPALAITGMAMKVDNAESRYIATDGDSIIHDGERIRLLYVDAPEMPSSPRNCRRSICPSGDPYAARDALQAALDSGEVRCEGDEIDMYGRRLAECFVTSPSGRSVSVNHWMLSTGLVALYRQ